MAPSARQLFEQTYDRPEPRSYFRLLAPLDYRMPAVASGFLARHGAAIAAARGKSALTVIDFACGFGAIGLLLKHRLSLAELYAHYQAEAETADPIEADRHFFAARRAPERPAQLVGIDIAAQALAYAERVGALDRAFAVNLLADEPPPALEELLGAADLVIESGAMGELLAPAMARILDRGGRPWLLLAPRGDVDDTPLRRLLAERGYRIEHCNRAPFRYRRFADPQERAEVLAAVTALGRAPDLWMDEAYFKLNLWLARPAADGALLPVEALMLENDGKP